MSIYLTLLIVATILTVIAFIKSDDYNSSDAWVGIGILSGLTMFFTFLICCGESVRSQTWPVSYKAFPTEKEIHVYVDDSDLHFSSKEKQDFDAWTQYKPGFVTKGYNSFGAEVKNTFSVK